MVSGMEGEASNLNLPAHPESAFTLPTGMGREQFKAMGTTVTLLLPEQHKATGASIVRSLFEEWEQTLSRFRPESELSRVNRLAGKHTIVSNLLFDVLMVALDVARATDGLYDPTLLNQLTALGYDRSFDTLPAAFPATTYTGTAGGAWRFIQVNRALREVVLPAGIQLDFGGIAKGMAVDAALEQLREAAIAPALVNAGGDLRVSAVPADTGSWSIAVPGKEQDWVIPFHHGAMATSGIARRHWKQGHAHRHHLLDPRSGLPVDNGLWSVTVVAGQCVQAETAAKVAFILGSTAGKNFLRDHHLTGLFVHIDGHWEAGDNWPTHLMRKLPAPPPFT